MKQLKIRSSSISKILGNGRGDFGLTDTAISYIENLVDQELYDFKDDISSKYLKGGDACEEESISLYNFVHFTSHEKNEERKENDWTAGTCDIDTGSMIIDIKSSWSSKTFPKTERQAKKLIKKSGYDKQLQNYMWLWGRDKAQVAFCLVDTPSDLIEYESNLAIHEVSHLPETLRVTTVDYDWDPSFPELVMEKVTACRKYANQYREEIENKFK